MELEGKREFYAAAAIHFPAEDALSIIDYVNGRARNGNAVRNREFLLPRLEKPVTCASALGWLLNQAAVRHRDLFRQDAVARLECAASSRAEIRECCGRLIQALGCRPDNGLLANIEHHGFLDLIDFESEEPISPNASADLVTTFDRASALCKELIALAHAAREEDRPAPKDPVPTGDRARDWLIEDLEKIYMLIWQKHELPSPSIDEGVQKGGPFIRFLQRSFPRIAGASSEVSALKSAVLRKRSREFPSPYFDILYGVELATSEEVARRALDPRFRQTALSAQNYAARRSAK